MTMTPEADGSRTVHLIVNDQTFDIPHTETMSPEQLTAAINEKLQAAGVTGMNLTMQNGQITVEKK